MMKIVVAVLALACAGVPVLFLFSSPDFGVSAQHPLGEFEAIDSWLLDRKLRKTEGRMPRSVVKRFGDKLEGAKIHKYELTTGFGGDVEVIVDAQGAILGIRATFSSGSTTSDSPYSSPEELVCHLWPVIYHRKPVFKEVTFGTGKLQRDALIDAIVLFGVDGHWQKDYRERLKEGTINDFVHLYRQ